MQELDKDIDRVNRKTSEVKTLEDAQKLRSDINELTSRYEKISEIRATVRQANMQADKENQNIERVIKRVETDLWQSQALWLFGSVVMVAGFLLW